jgi:carbon storage regulator
MLVLSRKVEEAIQIGPQVVVRVLGIENGQVKLGIDAPREVKIYRSELYEQIGKINVEAAKTLKTSAARTVRQMALQTTKR